MATTNDEAAIKAAVRDRYGSRAQERLDRETSGTTDRLSLPAAEDLIPLAAASDACCAPGDSGTEDACCAPAGPTEHEIDAARAFYHAADVSQLPTSVTDVAFGCGNPTAIAELHAGETVLDLGSGGGIDCFIAARQVGPAGRVIGVDMTDEMLALANTNKAKVGAENVEFRTGEIEALPVADATADVIISNCVINLSTDKDRVLREAFRVLKPGGRFRVSDLVLTRALTEAESQSLEEWAGCVAGALHKDDFAAKLAAAGFSDVRLTLQDSWRDGVHPADISALKPS